MLTNPLLYRNLTVNVERDLAPICTVADSAVVLAVLAVLALVHGVRSLLLDDAQDQQVLLTFAFIPDRYDTSVVPGGALPGGFGAEIWTFVTYSLLHADWTHLGVNSTVQGNELQCAYHHWKFNGGGQVTLQFGQRLSGVAFSEQR